MRCTPAGNPLSVSPRSLASAFTDLPDLPCGASVIYSLPAILGLAVTAILANHLSVLAIAEWGARQNAAMLTVIGFPCARTRASRRSSGCFGSSMGRRWPRR